MKAMTEVSVSALPGASKKLAARREAFLAAGRAVFKEKGFADATLDDVIARSGGSRQTLYTLFGGKQGLFEAIITDNCETIFHGMAMECLAARAMGDALEEFGERYLTIITSADCISLNRLVISEAPRMPELGQKFWSLGPGRSRSFLSSLFHGQVKQGILTLSDCAAAADHFLEMLSGTTRMQCLIGLRAPPTKAEIKKIVKCAVKQFLEGCRLKAVDPKK